MHSLAIALQEAGHTITGSDDRIYDPARTRLEQAGLLPPADGWHAERVHASLDAVILGMHAFEDNPELQKARSLGLRIHSFPEFIYQQSRDKQRVVIAGSNGKTTVTSLIMHVLDGVGKGFDYLVGAAVPGFDHNVRLDPNANLIIIEGDEYLASKLDPRPKFMLYRPHMLLLNNIAWDHMNVFPTEEVYVQQFENLLNSLDKAADIVYNRDDKVVARLVKARGQENESFYLHDFTAPPYRLVNGAYEIKLEGQRQLLKLKGKHNMANVAAAWEVCQLVGVEIEDFLAQVATFVGAQSRMEVMVETPTQTVIKDFAHAPAKVAATVDAVRESYKKANLIACVELHTFSSLNREFLPQYKGSLKKAHHKLVYINPKSFSSRRLEPITRAELVEAFGEQDLFYTHSREELIDQIRHLQRGNDVMLMMSSGTFGGMVWDDLVEG